MDDNVTLPTGSGDETTTLLSVAADYDIGNTDINIGDLGIMASTSTLSFRGNANVNLGNAVSTFGVVNSLTNTNIGGGGWLDAWIGAGDPLGNVYVDQVNSHLNAAWLNAEGSFGKMARENQKLHH